ncbi:hypothetical protein Xen7305DRAFT_00019300 [Xenococcus sp. PCC 7305]|nr:hypothetical protein Xen7305DRAFT_00019300 [Xenococcus sp. PCC 7305]
MTKEMYFFILLSHLLFLLSYLFSIHLKYAIATVSESRIKEFTELST